MGFTPRFVDHAQVRSQQLDYRFNRDGSVEKVLVVTVSLAMHEFEPDFDQAEFDELCMAVRQGMARVGADSAIIRGHTTLG